MRNRVQEPNVHLGRAYTTVVHRKFVADENGLETNLVTGVRGTYQKIVLCKNKDNLQTLAGRDDEIIKCYTQNGAGNPASNFIAVSADVTAPSTADTVLAGEITTNGMGRAQATTRTHTTGTNAWSLSLTFTDTTAETAAIVKYGLFTAISSGVLNHENTATTVTLEVGDQLIVSWTGSLG
ncbi:MAG: hypothetical protein KGI08_03570 [Thaumarchaeota archaeon]|nr:hypothetical protein [Nitrososphaerota archaeon]